MVHVSRQTLTSEELKQLFDQLNRTLGNLSSAQSELFLADLLGPEEKIMLAKRLAAIVMLHYNQSLYKVADTLKISSSTADTFRSRMDAGEYDQLFSVLQKDAKGYRDFLNAVDAILHLGGLLPHYGQTYQSEAFKKRH